MRLKQGFELRDVCGERVLVAQGLENIDFSHIINLNETAAFLWEKLQGVDFDVETATDLLTGEYDVDKETARADIERLFSNWTEIGILDD